MRSMAGDGGGGEEVGVGEAGGEGGGELGAPARARAATVSGGMGRERWWWWWWWAWALCAEDRRTGVYFPRSRALSSRICDGTVLRTMSSMLSTPTVSSMAAWSLSRGPRWRAANLSLAARAAAADDMCRGAPVLPMSARTAGWAKPRPSCEPRIMRIVGELRHQRTSISAHLVPIWGGTQPTSWPYALMSSAGYASLEVSAPSWWRAARELRSRSDG